MASSGLAAMARCAAPAGVSGRRRGGGGATQRQHGRAEQCGLRPQQRRPVHPPRCARGNTRGDVRAGVAGMRSGAGSTADGSADGPCPVGMGDELHASETAGADDRDEASSSSSCPYTAVKEGVSAVSEGVANAVSLRLPRVDLDSWTFLQSVIKAADAPAGMADAMLEWSNDHGMTVGIINRPFGPTCVSTVDPAVVEYVCYQNASNYKDRMLPDAFRYVTKYKGLTGSDGEYNRQHRLLCQKPFLYQPNLHDFAGVITDRVSAMIDAWDEAGVAMGDQRGQQQRGQRGGSGGAGAAHGASEAHPLRVDMNEMSQRVTLDIISLIAFNHDFRQVERTRREMLAEATSGDYVNEPDELLDAYNLSSEIMGQLFITPVPLLKLASALGVPKVVQLEESYETLERVGMSIVDQRRAVLAERAERDGGIKAECLLDTLVTATNPDGTPLSNDDLWGDVNDIMAAGHRTQASAMCVALYHLSRDLPLLEAAMAEVDTLGGRVPTYEDVKEGRLELIQRVVKEGLRMYAPINLFPRLAGGDDELPTGHTVEKGDFILLSSYAMGRNPRVWKDPMKFDPDRFLESNLVAMQEERGSELGLSEEDVKRNVQRILNGRDFVYTPFGAGPRSCIGGTFAQMSVTLILTTCLQRYHFRPSDNPAHPNGDELPLKYDTTIVFPEGVHMRMWPREKKGGEAGDAAELGRQAAPAMA
uniref:Cytochrome P450 n=1 Tax=Prasinoderma coloniale TaxID=156133 RepID=A0A7R9TQY4_9VIRI|mmetsp:Transcript_5058/g.20135  ORF Transcript_5058/g.20135 Transcript_5058/m.20135 type:complete len:704 (+) Transcript_5058:432-2543(+)